MSITTAGPTPPGDDEPIIIGVRHHSPACARLVADRILQFAEVAGPEIVIASTDCGLGGRLHPQIAWAKLESLVEGAALASREIYGR